MATEADDADQRDMRSLQAGDDLALNRLMERHREKVFHYLVRLSQDETEALDLAQETFVRVYLHRQTFKLGQRFTSWLYTIATNLSWDRLRWRARHPTVSIDSPSPGTDQTLSDTLPATNSSPNERLVERERAEEIKQALRDIPEELRTPLVLVEYENLAQAEIAEILHCTPKAVENRLYRARRLLREKLAHLLNESA